MPLNLRMLANLLANLLVNLLAHLQIIGISVFSQQMRHIGVSFENIAF